MKTDRIAEKENVYDIKDKRLLFVGASGHVAAAIEEANKLGVYTIAVNYSPAAYGKRIASSSAEYDTSER